MSKEVEPAEVMHFLNTLYSRYDQLLDTWGVYKVETVGDCYVVAGGLIQQDRDGFGCVVRDDAQGPQPVAGPSCMGAHMPTNFDPLILIHLPYLDPLI